MKVGTLTFHTGTNYGSILQAVALPVAVKKLGHDCQILNYHPSTARNWMLKFRNHSVKATLEYKINEFAGKIHQKTNREQINNGRAFDDFRDKYVSMTARYGNIKELVSIANEFDALICGSDQIWNPYYFDPVYYLGFVNDPEKKIAYAPSFGVDSIPPARKSRVSKCLNQFKYLSVREGRGKQLVEELTGQKAALLADPTLLLSVEEWDKMACPIDEGADKPYVLCYFLSKNPEYFVMAEKIARAFSYEIKVIPMVAGDFSNEHVIRKTVGPGEWITLVKNAAFVLTDSFHCSVFSILYHRSFYTFQRFKGNDGRGQNSRIINLLESANFTDRVVSTQTEEFSVTLIEEERFKTAEERMRPMIAESKNWLQCALDRDEK